MLILVDNNVVNTNKIVLITYRGNFKPGVVPHETETGIYHGTITIHLIGKKHPVAVYRSTPTNPYTNDKATLLKRRLSVYNELNTTWDQLMHFWDPKTLEILNITPEYIPNPNNQ